MRQKPHPFYPLDQKMTSQKTDITAIPFYRDERILKIIGQIVSTVAIFGFLIWAVINFIKAADARNMELSFGFLKEAAGFPISNPPIDYEAGNFEPFP